MKMARLLAVAMIGIVLTGSVVWAQAPERRTTTAPAVSPEKAKAAQAHFAAGRERFFQGQYQKAIERLQAAVAADPTKNAYRLLLAKAHRCAGQVQQAADLLEGILKDNPEHVEAGVELGQILSAQKQWKRVIEVLEPLLRFKHDYPLYHMLAEAQYQQENLDKAREYYEEAARLNPQSGGDHYQLGNIYLTQSRFAKAARAYERAVQLGIDSAALHFKLASVYFNLRNYLGKVTTATVIGGAVGQIKKDLFLIDPVPGQKDTFYVAGPASAIFQVVRAQEMGVTMPQIRFLEANIWLNARRYAKADALYKQLDELGRKLEKSDEGLFWYYWARTALGLDDYDAYLKRLAKAIEAEPEVYKPTLADAYVAVANRYQQRGETARYIEFLKKAVETNPLSARLHLALGDALWQANQRKGAVEQYRLVLELEPDHAERVRLLNRIRGEETPAATAAAAAPAADQ
jgi:tetratricopeptide (TPR) repeat protein